MVEDLALLFSIELYWIAQIYSSVTLWRKGLIRDHWASIQLNHNLHAIGRVQQGWQSPSIISQFRCDEKSKVKNGK